MTNYNPFSLDGKTILVTGASSGIGRTTAIECSRLGAHLVITGRHAENLTQTYNLLDGKGHVQIVADLSCPADIERLVALSPVIDGFVNNAGQGDFRLIDYLKQDIINDVYQRLRTHEVSQTIVEEEQDFVWWKYCIHIFHLCFVECPCS